MNKMKKLIGLIVLLAFGAILYAQDYVIYYDTEVIVTVQDQQEQITFTWTQELSPGMIGWRLYQSETSGQYAEPIAVIPFEAEADEYAYPMTIEADYGDSVTYYYVLTAVNQDGVESGPSNEVVYSAEFVYPVPFSPGQLRIVR
jgi:hypothetical protein